MSLRTSTSIPVLRKEIKENILLSPSAPSGKSRLRPAVAIILVVGLTLAMGFGWLRVWNESENIHGFFEYVHNSIQLNDSPRDSFHQSTEDLGSVSEQSSALTTSTEQLTTNPTTIEPVEKDAEKFYVGPTTEKSATKPATTKPATPKPVQKDHKNSVVRKLPTKPATTKAVQKVKNFSVSESGAWQGTGAVRLHQFHSILANHIVNFFVKENASTVLELGAGLGKYAERLRKNGLFVSCYDGNQNTQSISQGRCGIIDLSKPISLGKYDWVLSLEVGEHIPAQFEDVFLNNLDSGNRFGIVLSWALIGQGGTSHINNRNNSYIVAKMAKKGYSYDSGATNNLRKGAYYYFKETLMVFRRAVNSTIVEPLVLRNNSKV